MNTIDFVVAAAFVEYGARIEKTAGNPAATPQEDRGRAWFGPVTRHELPRPSW